MPVTTQSGISLNPDNNNYFANQSIDALIANNLNRPTFVLDNPDGVTVNLDSFNDATIYASNNAADEINNDQRLADTIRIYQAAFNREPDEEGLKFWADLYIEGTIDFNRMAEDFVNSDEFKDDFDGLDIEATVEKLYENVLGRESDPEGKAFWVKHLEEGNVTLAETLQFFANSEENVENTQETVATFSQSYNEANGNNAISTAQIDNLDTYKGSAGADTVFIEYGVDEDVAATARLYMAVLGREPEMEGLEYWVNQQKDGISSFTQVAGHFINQPEFIGIYDGMTNAQIVDTLYQNVLGRAPEEEGRSYWINQLNTGADTLAVVLTSFANSDEFVRNTQDTIKQIAQEYKEYTKFQSVVKTFGGDDTITIEANAHGVEIDTGLGKDTIFVNGHEIQVRTHGDNEVDEIVVNGGTELDFLVGGGDIVYGRNGSGDIEIADQSRDTKIIVGNNDGSYDINFEAVIDETADIRVDLTDAQSSYMLLRDAEGNPIVEIWGSNTAIREFAADAGITAAQLTNGQNNIFDVTDGVAVPVSTTDQPIHTGSDEINLEDGTPIQQPTVNVPVDEENEEDVSETPADDPVVTDDPVTNPDPDDVVIEDPFAGTTTDQTGNEDETDVDQPTTPVDLPSETPIEGELPTIDPLSFMTADDTIDTSMFQGTTDTDATQTTVEVDVFGTVAAQPEPKEVIDTSTPVNDTDQDVNVVGTQTNDDGYTQFNPF